MIAFEISESFDPVPALLGGALIGLATIAVYALNGAVAGISGVTARLLPGASGDKSWRLAFLVGLIGGAAATFAFWAPSRSLSDLPGIVMLVVAGFIVGVGTRLGGGCTSGHGVCGISRGKPRSILATIVFMLVAGVTVYAVRHVFAGAGA